MKKNVQYLYEKKNLNQIRLFFDNLQKYVFFLI